MILIVAQFLRHPPAAAGGGEGRRRPASKLGQHQFTTGEMLRTPQFYVLYAMFVMMATGGLLVTANAGPMAQGVGHSGGGAGAGDLAQRRSPTAAAASSGAGCPTRPAASWRWAIAFALQAVCLVLVLTVGRLSGTLFTVTLVLTFFTWGEVFSLFPSLVADYFGTKYATANYGVLYSAKGVASIIGGGVAAMLFEQLRQLDGVLLRQRRAGARRVGDRLQPARVASAARRSAVGVPATAK